MAGKTPKPDPAPRLVRARTWIQRLKAEDGTPLDEPEMVAQSRHRLTIPEDSDEARLIISVEGNWSTEGLDVVIFPDSIGIYSDDGEILATVEVRTVEDEEGPKVLAQNALKHYEEMVNTLTTMTGKTNAVIAEQIEFSQVLMEQVAYLTDLARAAGAEIDYDRLKLPEAFLLKRH